MIKDLTKVANKLDSIGLTKEADMLDRIIKKIAQDSSWEMEMFNKAKEVSGAEAEAWKDKVEESWVRRKILRYEENKFGYDDFDLESEGKIWTIYYDIEDLDNVIKEDTTNSDSRRLKQRFEMLTREHKELSDLVKEKLPNISGIFDGGRDFIIFIHNEKVYNLKPALGLDPERGDIELTILGKTVGGGEVDWPKNREEALELGINDLEELGGVEWLVRLE